VLSLAIEETRRYNHTAVGTEHVSLALLSADEGIAVKALAQLHVQPSEVRAQIETLHPAREQPVGNGLIGMTQQGKESIELAIQEAQSLGHHYIGTEHLLLGQLCQEESLAGIILRKSGATLEKARELVKQLLAEEQMISPSNPEQYKQS
jgi:ATP-dependent Clp protease ATP-binding subunit ClpC